MYRFLDKDGTVLYVGKAKDLKSRVSSYFTGYAQLGEKTRVLVSQIDKIHITIVESELESLLLEAFYIKQFSPKYNIRMTDGKSYPLIEVTLADVYPKVLLARRPSNQKSAYFGPYPSSSSVKLVLKTIRRIFPYQSVRNHPKRICLYHHLGLCPCPPMFDSADLKKQYRQNIRNLIRVLDGKSRTLVKEFEKEREIASREENFEEAQLLQKKITALRYITQPFRQPFEYDTNPNLRTDIRHLELDSLRDILNKEGYRIEILSRIECYDISHIQGSNTTASMVVLTEGEIDKSQYRKFKIRLEKTPDDFASMKEVLKRRLKHVEWEYPDLIVVDGGKGQVNSALEVLTDMELNIPLIGLAKREETIIISKFQISNFKSQKTNDLKNTLIDKENENFIEVSLPRESKALHLIMRIRDEAHRFAITYHRLLRSKHVTD